MEDTNELKIGKLVFRINDDITATVVECEKDAVAIEVPELVDGVPVDSVNDVFFETDTNGITLKMLHFYNEYKDKIEQENLHYLFY